MDNMKNKTIAITLFYFLLCHSVMAQKDNPFDSLDVARLQVMYDLTYSEDTTHLEWKGTERMLLLLGNEMSYFAGYKHYRLDRIRYQKMQDGTYWEWFRTGSSDYVGRYLFQLYKGYPKGKMTMTDNIFLTGKFLYEEDLGLFKWEILEDTTTIEGFLCQKAMCTYGGRTWVAWFTDELPFSDGPYKFHGLPGLILKVADTRNHYCFDFVSVEVPAQGTNIEWYHGIDGTEYVVTTRKKLQKIEDDLRENIMSQFDEQTSPDAQKRMYGVMRSRNNPIELDRK